MDDLSCKMTNSITNGFLEQFLAICYQILSTNPKDRKFYQDNKSMLKDKDPIRKEIKDISSFTPCSNKEFSREASK